MRRFLNGLALGLSLVFCVGQVWAAAEDRGGGSYAVYCTSDSVCGHDSCGSSGGGSCQCCSRPSTGWKKCCQSPCSQCQPHGCEPGGLEPCDD